MTDTRPLPVRVRATEKLTNPYEGRSYEALKALRRDILNLRTAHMRECERLMAEAKRVGAAMGSAPREPLGVADHAVLRWLERVEGVDIGAVRGRIVEAVNLADRVGDAHVVSLQGVSVCITENRVLTVLPDARTLHEAADVLEKKP